jgi:hypothetical protein
MDKLITYTFDQNNHEVLGIESHHGTERARRLGGGETALPPRGERRILSAIEVVSASRRMVYITGRSRVFVPFYVPCNHMRRKDLFYESPRGGGKS